MHPQPKGSERAGRSRAGDQHRAVYDHGLSAQGPAAALEFCRAPGGGVAAGLAYTERDAAVPGLVPVRTARVHGLGVADSDQFELRRRDTLGSQNFADLNSALTRHLYIRFETAPLIAVSRHLNAALRTRFAYPLDRCRQGLDPVSSCHQPLRPADFAT